jgi:hypothetical protein
LNPVRCKRFLSSPNRPDGLRGPHNVLQNGYPGSYPGEKLRGRAVDHSSRCNADIKNEWMYTILHLYAFIAYQGKNFNFLCIVLCYHLCIYYGTIYPQDAQTTDLESANSVHSQLLSCSRLRLNSELVEYAASATDCTASWQQQNKTSNSTILVPSFMKNGQIFQYFSTRKTERTW